MKILVLGCYGNVGSNIMSVGNLLKHDITGIGRDDVYNKKHYDIVFDCRAFFHKIDFTNHIKPVIDNGETFDCDKYVHISSIDCILWTTYGKAKSEQEDIHRETYGERLLVLRCGSIVCNNMTKGPVHDAQVGVSYTTNSSRFRLTSLGSIYGLGINMSNNTINNFSSDSISPVEMRNFFGTTAYAGTKRNDYSQPKSDMKYTAMQVLKGEY